MSQNLRNKIVEKEFSIATKQTTPIRDGPVRLPVFVYSIKALINVSMTCLTLVDCKSLMVRHKTSIQTKT